MGTHKVTYTIAQFKGQKRWLGIYTWLVYYQSCSWLEKMPWFSNILWAIGLIECQYFPRTFWIFEYVYSIKFHIETCLSFCLGNGSLPLQLNHLPFWLNVVFSCSVYSDEIHLAIAWLGLHFVITFPPIASTYTFLYGPCNLMLVFHASGEMGFDPF